MSPRFPYASRRDFRRAIVGAEVAVSLVQTYGELRGDGTYPVVGPSQTDRRWYCTIRVESGRVVAAYVRGLPRWWPW